MDQRELVERINRLEQQVRALLEGREVGYYTANSPWFDFDIPLTSTSYDGDSFSTTANTLIDLSTFTNALGETVPGGIKAVLMRCYVRDSGSAGASNLLAAFGPADNIYGALVIRPSGLPNDYWADKQTLVPCNADGDVYFKCTASGAGTMDVAIEIWGYIK